MPIQIVEKRLSTHVDCIGRVASLQKNASFKNIGVARPMEIEILKEKQSNLDPKSILEVLAGRKGNWKFQSHIIFKK